MPLLPIVGRALLIVEVFRAAQVGDTKGRKGVGRRPQRDEHVSNFGEGPPWQSTHSASNQAAGSGQRQPEAAGSGANAVTRSATAAEGLSRLARPAAIQFAREGGSMRHRTRFTEELTAESFDRRVRVVVNGSSQPTYFPVVMFHMPWCDHCVRAIPEFEDAARTVAKAAKGGQLKSLQAVPKFFIISCDADDVRNLCLEYTGKSYPSIILFRDWRVFRFNRPRLAAVFSWWAFRVARPAVLALHSVEDFRGYASQGPAFLLVMRSTKDHAILQAWEQIALDYLELYAFFHTVVGTSLASSFGQEPNVHALGPPSAGLAPIPFRGPLNLHLLRSWVNFNQFPTVTELSAYIFGSLRDSGLTVVSMVFRAGDRKSLRAFRAKVLELRPRARCLFAVLNQSIEENARFLAYRFPLVSFPAASNPRIFAFAGEGKELYYWEDPRLSNPEQLSEESIDELLGSLESLQDESPQSWMKEKRKLYCRFALKSWTTLISSIAMPIVVAVVLFRCFHALVPFRYDTRLGTLESSEKSDHVD